MNERGINPIPQQRVLDRMDEYMSRRDYAGAERHLLFWLAEAKQGGDLRGELLVRNELVGHYRKTGERDKAFESADAALALLDRLDFGETISAGTTYVNVATAIGAFGEHERALSLFEKARALYEGSAHTRPQLLGGLYNNMALTCAALGRWDDALSLYDLAIQQPTVPESLKEHYRALGNTASACVGCQSCESRCPFEVTIAERMQKAAALFGC